MSAKSRQGESQVASVLREENIVESRPITAPCRKVVGGPVSNGLFVLPPDSDKIQFNSTASIASQTKKRYGSADRVQRKLCTVERCNSAGGRLIDERKVLEESQNHEHVQTELKTSQPSLKKADVKPESIAQELTNGKSDETVNDVNNCLDNIAGLHVNEDLPIELKAEFLSCVMEKNYEKALHLCNEMLVIDPENITAVEFQTVIKEKLQQGISSDESSEEDESETDDTDNDNNGDESGNSDDKNGGEEEEDEDEEEEDDQSSDDDDEEEESESDTDSDIEIPTGPINLLMGGLPLRPSSVQPDDRSRNT